MPRRTMDGCFGQGKVMSVSVRYRKGKREEKGVKFSCVRQTGLDLASTYCAASADIPKIEPKEKAHQHHRTSLPPSILQRF